MVNLLISQPPSVFKLWVGRYLGRFLMFPKIGQKLFF